VDALQLVVAVMLALPSLAALALLWIELPPRKSWAIVTPLVASIVFATMALIAARHDPMSMQVVLLLAVGAFVAQVLASRGQKPDDDRSALHALTVGWLGIACATAGAWWIVYVYSPDFTTKVLSDRQLGGDAPTFTAWMHRYREVSLIPAALGLALGIGAVARRARTLAGWVAIEVAALPFVFYAGTRFAAV
jgi:hypothetical protein